MNKQMTVREINMSLAEQLQDKETVRALITTTFNGMSEQTMRQAMMEGMMRGFTFQDFLQKDVYAIPYGAKYSLVTSIDYMRKIAAQHGLVGKNAPEYEEENGKIKTCSVTVKRLVSGVVGEYTAKVYFNEYSTGKNLWVSKPRTMIAKVAEMHALRMAFPEELSNAYIEDEYAKDTVVEEPIDLSGISGKFDECDTQEDLKKAFLALSPKEKGNKEVVRLAKERKEVIQKLYEPKDAEISVDTPDGTEK